MADTRWGLTETVIGHIRAVLPKPADVYRHLETSNKYWEPKICKRDGVKRSTAEALALRFLNTLEAVAEHSDTVHKGVVHARARTLLKEIYQANIDDHYNVDSMVEKIESSEFEEPASSDPGNVTAIRAGVGS